MSSTSALQKAIFAALTADATLTGLIGASRIFDDVPPGARPPYLVFAESSLADWSTGTEAGEAHTVALEIWSSQRGRKQVAAIAASARAALDSIGPLDAPFHLVHLRHETTRLERDPQTEWFRGVVRMRALVEVGE